MKIAPPGLEEKRAMAIAALSWAIPLYPKELLTVNY
jgi:hypothetical protein